MSATSQEDRIDKCIEELFRREELYADKRFAAAEAEHTYRIRYAVEFAKAEGAIKAREMDAIIAVKAELTNRDITAAESDIAYQKLQDARAVLSARQTLLKAQEKMI